MVSIGISFYALRVAFHKSSDDDILNWDTYVFRMDHMFSMTLISGNCGDQSLRRQIFFSSYKIVYRDVWYYAPSCMKTSHRHIYIECTYRVSLCNFLWSVRSFLINYWHRLLEFQTYLSDSCATNTQRLGNIGMIFSFLDHIHNLLPHSKT